MAQLGVNIDHIATIREARKTTEPSLIQAASLAEMAGCDSITIHLREDERHIKKEDVYVLKRHLRTRLNLEMSLSRDIVNIAKDVKPQSVCLVPENRKEVTTEGGLEIASRPAKIKSLIDEFHDLGIKVSLFIDPDPKGIEMAKTCGADMIELHTGAYANASAGRRELELAQISNGVDIGLSLGLVVNAGHGLTYFNIKPLAVNPGIHEFNIGHSIISRAVLVGMDRAVKDMLAILATTLDK